MNESQTDKITHFQLSGHYSNGQGIGRGYYSTAPEPRYRKYRGTNKKLIAKYNYIVSCGGSPQVQGFDSAGKCVDQDVKLEGLAG